MPFTLRRPLCVAILMASFAGPVGAQTNPPASNRGSIDGMIYLNSDRPIKQPANYQPPLSYRDRASGIVFYVESDRRHVTAIDPAGKVLWIRFPFLDAKLPPYREDNPPIVSIGAPVSWMVEGPRGRRIGRFVAIEFSTTQFGLMNFETGEFLFMGQD